MEEFLIKYGYGQDEIKDEIYCRMIEKMSLKKLFKKVNLHIPKKLRRQFKDSYDDYYAKIYT